MAEAQGMTNIQLRILEALQPGQTEVASIGDLVSDDLQELVEVGYVGIYRAADGTARVRITEDGKDALG